MIFFGDPVFQRREKTMIRDRKILSRFEDERVKKEPQLSFREALQVFEAMWEEAVALGTLPLSQPLDGIEVDIRLARVLNCLQKSFPG